MQVIPVAKPATSAENNISNAQSESQRAAKARAIAMLTGGAPASQVDQSKVAVEELSAVSPESVQKDTSEEPVSAEVSSEKPKAEDPVSPQLALLARKEKQLRMEAQKIKAERDSIKAKEAELEKSYSQKLQEAEKSWKSRLSEDPLGILNESGVSYDAITERMLNAPKPEDQARDAYTKKLESRLAELESKQEKQAKSYEEAQSAQYKQALNQIKNDVTSLVNSDLEYETVKETGSIGDVVDLIEKTFKAEGVLLSIEEAAKAVEDHLLEEYDKLSKISKLQKRIQAAQAAKQDPGKKLPESPQQLQPGKTLTNNMSTTRPLTPRERAIAVFKGQNKS